jgi:hypothetical protein
MEPGGADGLGEIGVEACRLGLAPILDLAVAGQRHQVRDARLRRLAGQPGQRVAVHTREPDVDQRDLGPEGTELLEGGRRVLGRFDLVTGVGMRSTRRPSRAPALSSTMSSRRRRPPVGSPTGSLEMADSGSPT